MTKIRNFFGKVYNDFNGVCLSVATLIVGVITLITTVPILIAASIMVFFANRKVKKIQSKQIFINKDKIIQYGNDT